MSRLGPELTLGQIDDWFKIGKRSAKSQPLKTVARSKLGGRWLDPKTGQAYVEKEETNIRNPRTCSSQQNDYAEYYKQQEEEAYSTTTQQVHNGACASRHMTGADTLDAIETETITTVAGPFPEDYNVDKSNHIYENYDFSHKYEMSLPITQYSEQIVSTIESNQVTVIQGSTGSGKTTQVPQYILDHYARENRYCNIIVTQPRRIAAMSIARRVCQERNWHMGGVCGYQVAMNKVASEETRLMYVTTGVLLQKLISAKNMLEYTHVILDEVHERDQDTDFALLVVRKLLRTNSRNVRVILMSATFDSDMFARYFSVPVLGILEQAPVVSVEGRNYTVSEYYVEDLQSLGPLPVLDPIEPCISKESMLLAKMLIMKFDDIEIQEYGQDAENPYALKRGTILVFLPGLAEIQELDNALKDVETKHNLAILPLHSSITIEEQARVFVPPKHRLRKIILSTNIAESSITVPDIKYVIDFCLTRNLVCDVETNYTSLQVEWASKASCTQRKGRAGRVSNGRVYRMVTRSFWSRHISDYGIPEMQRCPLEQLVLHVKLLDLGEPKAILGLALSPPNLDDIEKTILILKQVGALASLRSGAVNPHDGELTFIGRVLASLPVDIRIGKLLVLGFVFGVFEESLIIGAALSLKNFHARPYKVQFEAYRHKLAWARGSFSDCFASLHAFQVWEENKENRFITTREQEKWCRTSFIQLRRINEVALLRDELAQRLKTFNIRKLRKPPNYRRNLSYEKYELVLKMVLAGAFYPNYFLRGPSDEETAIRAMSGKNPFTTVMVKSLPRNQGAFYKSAVESLFALCGHHPQASFEETRAYIEFAPSMKQEKNIDGQEISQGLKFLLPVYMAVKMRLLRMPLEIQELDADDARKRLEQLSLMYDSNCKEDNRLRTNRIKAVSDLKKEMHHSTLRQVPLPGADKTCLPVFVTVVLSCGHFWGHYADPDTWKNLDKLQRTINYVVDNRCLKPFNETVSYGTICLAPYQEMGDQYAVYYRARVEEVSNPDNYGRVRTQVFFVDYGNYEEVDKDKLLKLDVDHSLEQELLGMNNRGIDPTSLVQPFQAFECFLAHIKPSPVNCPNGQWSKAAKEFFAKEVSEKELFAKIYSVVHGTMRVDLIYKHVSGREVNINELLIKKMFADQGNEDFISRQNHSQRAEEARYPDRPKPKKTADWMEVQAEELRDVRRGGPKIHLHGPFCPYEMTFYSMTNMGRLRAARIERDSVNSVALDDEPQDSHARMMIASHVKLNPAGNTMVAEDTTLMPFVHGLPAITALLFSPTVELRTDPAKECYIGALCGLGRDIETSYPALPDYDMEITFDTKLENDDIARINGVRMVINIALGTDEGTLQWATETMLKIQDEAQHKLVDLVLKRRESMEPRNYSRPYRWNQINPDDIIPHTLDNTKADCPKLLNLLTAVFLHEDEEDSPRNPDQVIQMKRQHKAWLHKVVRMKPPYNQKDILCELCNIVCKSVTELEMHLATMAHIDQEMKVR